MTGHGNARDGIDWTNHAEKMTQQTVYHIVTPLRRHLNVLEIIRKWWGQQSTLICAPALQTTQCEIEKKTVTDNHLLNFSKTNFLILFVHFSVIRRIPVVHVSLKHSSC